MTNGIEQRQYFGYSQLAAAIRRSLSEAKQLPFIVAVEAFGLEGVEPDFSADVELLEAWQKVRPELAKGWKNAASGQRGGRITQAKRQPKPASKPKPQEFAEPLADEPDQPFLLFIRKRGFQQIAKGSGALNKHQLRYLFNRFGSVAASAVLWKVEATPAEQRKASVFEIARGALLGASSAFDRWFAATFPKLASRPADRRLTFGQYAALRCNFGRANVAVKLSQMEGNKQLNPNAFQAETAESWLLRSIRSNPSSYHHLTAFNDAPQTLPAFPLGYDSGFDLPITKPKVIQETTPKK